MQIHADVTNRVIKIGDSFQTPALGAAMFGAVAAGSDNGGFDTILDATNKMARIKEEVITPIPENVAVYDNLYKDRKSTRLNSSHVSSSYAVFCLKKKTWSASCDT